MPEIVRTVEIKNRYGLHVRPSSILAKIASRYENVEIFVHSGEKVANGKSIMQLLSLGARVGERLKLVVEGNDAEEVADEIAELVSRQFDMEEDEQQCQTSDQSKKETR